MTVQSALWPRPQQPVSIVDTRVIFLVLGTDHGDTVMR